MSINILTVLTVPADKIVDFRLEVTTELDSLVLGFPGKTLTLMLIFSLTSGATYRLKSKSITVVPQIATWAEKNNVALQDPDDLVHLFATDRDPLTYLRDKYQTE